MALLEVVKLPAYGGWPASAANATRAEADALALETLRSEWRTAFDGLAAVAATIADAAARAAFATEAREASAKVAAAQAAGGAGRQAELYREAVTQLRLAALAAGREPAARLDAPTPPPSPGCPA